MTNRLSLSLSLSLVALTSASANAAQGQGHQITPQLTDYVVVKTNSQVPPPAGTFATTGLPTVVEVGGVYTVAFWGSKYPDPGGSEGIYYWDTNMASPLAAFTVGGPVTSIEQGALEFSGSIATVDSGVPPAVSTSGSISHLVTLTSTQVTPTYNGQGIVLHTSPLSGDVVVANKGQSVNGQPYLLDAFTRPVAIDNIGVVGFQCSLLDATGGFAGTGIFRNATVGIDKVAARGDSADGTSPASTFLFVGGNSLNTRDQQWNSANRPAFYGTTGASGPNAEGANGIWAETGTGVVAVALSGQPSWPNGNKWATFESPSINDSGDVAFRACESASSCFSEGIWARIGGFNRLIAKTNGNAPIANGDPSNVAFLDFGMPVIDAQGRVAFWATTSPGGAEGIWIADGTGQTGVRRVAFKGDTVRGTGTTIDSPFVDIAIADTGQVAFKADLTDGTQALFVESEYQSLVKLARTSEFYDFPNNGGSIKIGIVNFYPGASSQGVGGLYGDPITSTDIVAVAYQLIEDPQFGATSTVILTVVGP